MYRREAGTSKKKPARYVGIPSPAASKASGSQKAINKSTVQHSAPSPAPRPDVTLGGDNVRKTGHSKPPKVSKSKRPIGDIPYTRKQAKEAKQLQKARKSLALAYLFPKNFNAEAQASALESFYTEPTKLARNNFTSVSKEMFKKLGLQGKMPKLVYNDVAKEPGTKAYAYRGRNAVYVEPGQAERAKYDKGEYLTFAHEAAHTRQTSKKNSEGGAEEFARIIGGKALKRIGVDGKFHYATPEYRRRAKKVRRHKGKRYVTKGQFEYK